MSLTVVRSMGLVTVQDAGRPGHMHEGLAPGGALVPELLVEANRHAGNPDEAAAIEVMGTLTLRADEPVGVSTDTGPVRQLVTGAEVTVVSDRRRVAYLAVSGGIDAPRVLGSRAAQLSAGLGRLLRQGDLVLAGHGPVMERPVVPVRAGGPIDVIAGPDLDAFARDAIATLVGAAWIVSPSSNRVGTRLEGPRIGRNERPEMTRPMVRGAIEVPRDGQPIVLGPEHPTTGGYPVIAVVASADLGRLFVVPAGDVVRFRVREFSGLGGGVVSGPNE